MANVIDEELARRTRALLEPGEIDLRGAIVHTELGSDEELAMHDVTVEVGEIIADRADVDDWYVYSGNDTTEFASNQHQGLQIEDDGFVWECQQLLRDGTFDLVFYYEASADHESIIAAARDAGYRVTGVEPQ